MSRWTTSLAWGLVTLFIVFIGFGLWLQYLRGEATRAFIEYLALAVAFGLFAVMGALIVSRRPDNTMGWLYCAIGVGTGYTYVSPSYSSYALDHPSRDLPLVAYATLLESVIWATNFALITCFALVLFPTGRPPSRRWAVIAYVAGITIVISAIASIFSDGPILGMSEEINNPLGISMFGDVPRHLYDVAGIVTFLCWPLSIVALFVRFRRARSIERQQIKWLAVACVAGFAIVTGDFVFGLPVGRIGFAVAVGLIPVMTGLAILRYRLFDIDVVINRTIVYAIVMALLVVIYSVCVLLLQTLLGSVTGSSSIAVAVSTLAAVALFQPIRSRVQSWVNRRFYRTRYNTALALTQFGQTVRDEVDIERLQLALSRLLAETMQPQRVAFWIAESESRMPTGGSVHRAE